MEESSGNKLTDQSSFSRRGFLGLAARCLSVVASVPLVGALLRPAGAAPKGRTAKAAKAKIAKTEVEAGESTLLKNGLVVDGTGSKGFQGSLLIKDGKIEKIFRDGEEIPAAVNTVDCNGLVIAPGFIDAHSHMDWYLPIGDCDQFTTPFAGQGITTFVAGNCGYGIAGIRKNTAYMDKVLSIAKDLEKMQWTTMEEYYAFLRRKGMSHNMACFAGHGSTRASIRGFDASPLKPDEMKEMLALLEEAMDQGACGVSFGLMYEPGIFASTDEIREIAKLIKKKNKVLSVHMRAYSALAPGYPMSIMKVLLDKVVPFDAYTPHNLLAIDEMLSVARDTGVRMQLSHLMFAGTRSFKTCDGALERIDKAIKEGLDIKTDTYSYHCGQSKINVVLPPWFLAKAPAAFKDRKLRDRLKGELNNIQKFLGFGYNDIQITYANDAEFNKYNGMFLGQIAKARGMDWFDSTMDLAERSNGTAAVLNHRYSNMEIIETLMRHPAVLFMTDSLPSRQGVQNPAASGCFPLFLQYARDKKLISLEEAVYKMSGASAERFQIRDRGYLKEGLAADITVFNWNTVKDNNTLTETSNAPSGIEAVFINGKRVLEKGGVDRSVKAGAAVLI